MRRLCLRRENGQVLVISALMLTILLAVAALVIDIGRAYLAQRKLQQAVDAAAIAAGQALPDSLAARGQAIAYSATGANAHPAAMTAEPPIISFKCLQTLVDLHVPCQTDPDPNGPCATTSCNAVQVTQTATVPTLFARLFKKSFTVTARATVGMRGGTPRALDIMIVLDRTGSMNEPCGAPVRDPAGGVVISDGDTAKIDCAKDGIRQLLRGLYPCDPRIRDSCDAAEPLDKVGLIVFPPLNARDSTPHDGTGDPSHSNVNLETSASCSGNLTSRPPWYAPGIAFPAWYLDASDVGYGSAGVNEVQTVTSQLTSGSFTLAFDGQTTGAIPWNADYTVVQAELAGLSTIGSGNVSVVPLSTGTGREYQVTFQGTLARTDVTQLAAEPSASVTVSTVTGGSGPRAAEYAFAPLSNDFRVTPRQGLNPASRLVQAITWVSCQSGTTADGFASESSQGYPGNRFYGVNSLSDTYYTGAILAAQDALATELVQHPSRSAQPVIIFLSDGEANTGGVNPCASAVSAAQTAAQAGTQVYSIAYKLSRAQLCKNQNGTPETPAIDAYTAMARIARDADAPTQPALEHFYCPGTVDQHPTLPCQAGDTLAEVFRSIGASLTTSRILPDDTP